MIHQHVSFPYDPVTGQAVTDLKPECGLSALAAQVKC
jgi:hypothetical protein